MRSFKFAVFVNLLIGCATEPPVSVEPSVVPVAPVYEPKHAYDNRLITTEDRAQWESGILELLDKAEALTPPDKYFELIPDFQQGMDIWIGDTGVWDLPVPVTLTSPSEFVFDGPDPSVGVAQALEDNGKELEAAHYWLALERSHDALRCAHQLENENEWAASAGLALYLDDQEMFERGIDGLTQVNRITDRGYVLSNASVAHVDWVWKLIIDRDWNIQDMVKDRDALALAALHSGNQDLLIQLIELDLDEWRAMRAPSTGPGDRTVMLIVALASVSQSHAYDLAEQYLRLPHQHVVTYDDDVNGTLHPVRGTFELWELVKDHPEAASSYQTHVRSWFYNRYSFHSDGSSGHDEGEDGYRGFAPEWNEDCANFGCKSWFGPNLLFTYIRRSRQYAGLSTMWEEMLDGLEVYCYGSAYGQPADVHRRPVFVQNFGYALLNLPFDHMRAGLTPAERFLLGEVAEDSHPEQLVNAWEEYYRTLLGDYTFELLFQLMTQGEVRDEDQQQMLATISERHPDFCVDLPGESPEEVFQACLLNSFRRDMQVWEEVYGKLDEALVIPVLAMGANLRARAEREEHGVRLPTVNVVDTEGEVRERLSTVLVQVRDRAPWAYQAFVEYHPDYALSQ